MDVLFLLTGIALAIFLVAVAALVWSVRSGQLDDLDTPAVRLLSDGERPSAPAVLPTKDSP